MKTFRMLGMALVAIVMGLNLSSCSKDNPNGGDISNEKKLVKMVNPGEIFTFTYDNEGRLTSATLETEYGFGSHFIWGDDIIKVNNDYTLTLENGLVQNSSKGNTFTYNSSNRILKYSSNDAIWDKDKLMSVGNYTLTYGDCCKKGYFPLVPFMMFDYYKDPILLYLAHPEIVGMRTKQLPTGMNGRTLSYEFNKEGYISKVNMGGVEYTLTWE
jgi:YD repeat-containing protein